MLIEKSFIGLQLREKSLYSVLAMVALPVTSQFAIVLYEPRQDRKVATVVEI